MAVLLVEDDYMVRVRTADRLRDAGFDVIEAATSDQAAELIRNAPRPLTALVTDIQTSRVSREAAVTALMRERWPKAAVVITSDHPDVLSRNWEGGKNYVLLRKPFSMTIMVSVLMTLTRRASN